MGLTDDKMDSRLTLSAIMDAFYESKVGCLTWFRVGSHVHSGFRVDLGM